MMDTISDHQTQATKPTGSLANDLTLIPSAPDLELMDDAPRNSLEGSESYSPNSDELNDYNSDSSFYYDDGLYNDVTLDLQTQLDAVDLPPGVEASIPLLEQPIQSPHLAVSNSPTNFSQFNSQAEMKMKEKAEVWSQQPSGNQFKVPAMKFEGVEAFVPWLDQPVQSVHQAATNNTTIPSQLSSLGGKKMKGKANIWWQQQPFTGQFKKPTTANFSGVDASIPWIQPPVQGLYPAAANSSMISTQFGSHNEKEIKGWKQPFGRQFKVSASELGGVEPPIPLLEQPVQMVQQVAPNYSTMPNQFNFQGEKGLKGNAGVWWQQPFGNQFSAPAAAQFGGVEATNLSVEQAMENMYSALNSSTISSKSSSHGEKEMKGNAGVWWQQPFGSQFAAPAAAQFGGLEATNLSVEQATENVYSAAFNSSIISSISSAHGEKEMQGNAGVWWQLPFGSQFAAPAAAHFGGVEAANFSVEQFMENAYSAFFNGSTISSKSSSHGEKEMIGKAEAWWKPTLGGQFKVPITEFGGVDASIPWLEQPAQYVHQAAPNSSTMFGQLSSQSGKKMKGKAQIWQQQQPFGSQVKVPTPNFGSVEASIPWLEQSVQSQHLAIPKSSKGTSQASFQGEKKMKGKAEVLRQQPFESHTEEKKDVLQQNAESQKEVATTDSLTVAGQSVSSGRNKEVENDFVEKFRLFKQFDIVQDHSDHHYTHWTSKSMQAQRNWTKTIQQEWNSLEKDLPGGIFVRVYEERMDLLRAVIVGPEGTPYQSGLFFFDVFFPSDYPNTPPLVFYYSGGLRLNPNLYNCGKVCLSLLNTWQGDKDERWIPGKSSMLQLLLSIQALVLNEKPFYNEPGYEAYAGYPEVEIESDSYSENAFILSCKTMVYILRRPPKHFEVFVAGHFCEKAHAILLDFKACMKGSYPSSKKHIESAANGGLPLRADYFPILQMLVQELTSNGAKDCEQFLLPENW